MWAINLKIFIRQFADNPLFNLIVIAGLSLGLTGVVLLGLYIKDELSYDAHHPNAGSIYRISFLFTGEDEPLPLRNWCA